VRILIVDDDSDVRASLVMLLELDDHMIYEAGGATMALTYSDEPLDLILVDIYMPGMNGLELAREFRRRGCTAVIASISGSSEYPPSAIEAASNCEFHLLKPLDTQHLSEVVAMAQRRSDELGGDI
jgi:YesN/AraC family two-component response regulator